MRHNNTAVMALSRTPNETRLQKTLALNDWYLKGQDWDYPWGSIQMLGKSDGEQLRAMAPHFVAWGAKLTPEGLLEDVARHGVDFWMSSEDLPRPDSRVTLEHGTARLALPTNNNLEGLTRMRKKFDSMLADLGFHKKSHQRGVYLHEGMNIAATAHQAGTARFGTDPVTSVLDVNCKAHELDNLYVVDSSFFASIGAVNPTLTIIANTLRVGEHLLDATAPDNGGSVRQCFRRFPDGGYFSPKSHMNNGGKGTEPATRADISCVYAAGTVQGVVLVTFPAASAIFTSPAHYGLSSTQYGSLFLPQVITAIAASFVGGAAARRYSLKRVLLAGIGADVASMALLIVSQFCTGTHALAYGLLLVATAFLGVGFGLVVPALNTFAADFHPANVDKAVLVLNALLGLGTALRSRLCGGIRRAWRLVGPPAPLGHSPVRPPRREQPAAAAFQECADSRSTSTGHRRCSRAASGSSPSLPCATAFAKP